MTEPGNNCPECDRRIRSDGSCVCGWSPQAKGDRPKCQDCGEQMTWRYLHDGYDGASRCGSCHIKYLQRRAAPADDPDVLKSREEFRRIMERAMVRWATKR